VSNERHPFIRVASIEEIKALKQGRLALSSSLSKSKVDQRTAALFELKEQKVSHYIPGRAINGYALREKRMKLTAILQQTRTIKSKRNSEVIEGGR
jgi:hypothetical protein